MLEIDKRLYKKEENSSKSKKYLKWALGAAIACSGIALSITIVFNNESGYQVVKQCDGDKQAQWALDCIEKGANGLQNRKRALIIDKCYNKARKLYCKKEKI